MQRHRSIITLAVLVLACGAAPVLAQGRAERPYRGLFAGGIQDPQQTLTATGSLGGGFDNNVVADAFFGDQGVGRVGDLNSNVKGGVGQASGGLNYGLFTSALTVSASGS